MTDELFRAEKAYIPEWLQSKANKGADTKIAQQVCKQVAALSKKSVAKASGDAAAQVSSMAARNVK